MQHVNYVLYQIFCHFKWRRRAMKYDNKMRSFKDVVTTLTYSRASCDIRKHGSVDAKALMLHCFGGWKKHRFESYKLMAGSIWIRVDFLDYFWISVTSNFFLVASTSWMFSKFEKFSRKSKILSNLKYFWNNKTQKNLNFKSRHRNSWELLIYCDIMTYQ